MSTMNTNREKDELNEHSVSLEEQWIAATNNSVMWNSLALAGSIAATAAFFLSWGTSRNVTNTQYGFAAVVMGHMTGASAGPFGYVTLALAVLATLAASLSFAQKFRREMAVLQLWVSGFGTVFVVGALLTHPQIGWPAGPVIAIAGFAIGFMSARMSIRIIAKQRKDQEQTPAQNQLPIDPTVQGPCPNCGMRISAALTKCPGCQAALNAAGGWRVKPDHDETGERQV